MDRVNRPPVGRRRKKEGFPSSFPHGIGSQSRQISTTVRGEREESTY